jgi:hypothetical protein
MSLLLVGDRADVLLIKYRLLNQNWRLDIQQCYSLDSAEEKLRQSAFDCLIYVPFTPQEKSAQLRRLGAINQEFKVSIRVWQD